ncbi:MAG: hypothetical protein KatS3mg071_2387 [Meiothermus sp.]|nr:MAG: hypothetical protein KatS3mg071_2387 [Meiothermus sp.]
MVVPPTPENLERAAQIIRSGGLVAFPTETVYGLGANALDARAAARIFEAKERPSFDPLIVHVADRGMLQKVVREVPAVAEQLMERFWPGPLTLVLPRSDQVPGIVTSGLPTVAVRMPAHPVAQALIRQAGVPLAAPSANPFGYLSPTRAEHVRADAGGAGGSDPGWGANGVWGGVHHCFAGRKTHRAALWCGGGGGAGEGAG